MNRMHQHLRLYNPPEEVVEEQTTFEPRDIIPIRRKRATIISGRYAAPVDRARVIRENAVCPECEALNVEPLELHDAVISPRNRMPVPGTATIVGFHCNSCDTEWPVYELITRRNG